MLSCTKDNWRFNEIPNCDVMWCFRIQWEIL